MDLHANVEEVHQDTPITAESDSITPHSNSVRRLETGQIPDIT